MIRVNGEERTFVEESVAELLARLAIEPRGIAVAVDGDVVRRSAWAQTLILDDSVSEILTAVAGG